TSKQSLARASKLPGDPGFDLKLRELTITEEKEQLRRTVFGYPIVDRFTGADVDGSIRRFKARNSYLDVGGVPIMYFPYLSGDVNDPTGPLQNLIFRQDCIFGIQFLTSWSILELIGVKKLPGERWDLMADYLAKRGPAVG